jgi:hypothetical protein
MGNLRRKVLLFFGKIGKIDKIDRMVIVYFVRLCVKNYIMETSKQYYHHQYSPNHQQLRPYFFMRDVTTQRLDISYLPCSKIRAQVR